jgi:hypothetical protein
VGANNTAANGGAPLLLRPWIVGNGFVNLSSSIEARQMCEELQEKKIGVPMIYSISLHFIKICQPRAHDTTRHRHTALRKQKRTKFLLSRFADRGN